MSNANECEEPDRIGLPSRIDSHRSEISELVADLPESGPRLCGDIINSAGMDDWAGYDDGPAVHRDGKPEAPDEPDGDAADSKEKEDPDPA
ncbi:hypothetical protein [Streptomyces agglomeratus]|uniref:hypothetical protein n=1 Tax=Streptomyces agglomeratus TaxID=285458 RepID=UPI00114CA53B|nr:hypothetical protein [Streptomyces agglomeratus]